MRDILKDASTRRFFAAWAQSSVGSGAGYVGMLVLAYQTFRSPWAVAGVLLAEQLPCMFGGPLLGAFVDRVPRRTAAIAADLIGCAAFVGLALAASYPVVLALAVLAGVGFAIAQPAAMAGLPEVVDPRRLPAATSLHAVIEEAGTVAGPLLAALLLAGGDASTLMLVNGASFAVSAVLLLFVRFTPRTTPGEAASGPESEPGSLAGSAGAVRAGDAARPSLAGSALAAVRWLRAMPGVRTLVATSAIGVFAWGMLNVAELLFARDVLGAGDTGFSLLVGALSVGMIAGALAGSRSRDGRVWRREYLLGLVLMGITMLALAAVPSMALALPLLALCGYGNGIAVVHERLLLQHTVAPALHGRVFGIRRMLLSWSFCGSYLLGGAVAAAAGPRVLMALAGVAMLGAFCWGAASLRGAWVARRTLAGAA